VTILRVPFSYDTPILRVLFSERWWEKTARQQRQIGVNTGYSHNHSLLHLYVSDDVFGVCFVETLVAGLHSLGVRFWMFSGLTMVQG
jgi:hypothetical protein